MPGLHSRPLNQNNGTQPENIFKSSPDDSTEQPRLRTTALCHLPSPTSLSLLLHKSK